MCVGQSLLLAWSNDTSPCFSVKKIPVGSSRSWLVRVLEEVRALERLHHPNIIDYKHSWLESFRPSDFGPEVPCLFVLMEYANCGSLADLLWPDPYQGLSPRSAARARARRAARRRGRPADADTDVEDATVLPESVVLSLFLGVCDGLRHLHRCGLVHRDIKPENLLLTSQRREELIEADARGDHTGATAAAASPSPSGLLGDMRVVISDFGESGARDASRERSGNTGTWQYW